MLLNPNPRSRRFFIAATMIAVIVIINPLLVLLEFNSCQYCVQTNPFLYADRFGDSVNFREALTAVTLTPLFSAIFAICFLFFVLVGYLRHNHKGNFAIGIIILAIAVPMQIIPLFNSVALAFALPQYAFVSVISLSLVVISSVVFKDMFSSLKKWENDNDQKAKI